MNVGDRITFAGGFDDYAVVVEVYDATGIRCS